MTCGDHEGDAHVQESLDGNVVGDEIQRILTQLQGVSEKKLVEPKRNKPIKNVDGFATLCLM